MSEEDKRVLTPPPTTAQLLGRIERAVALLEVRDTQLLGLVTNLTETREEVGELRGELQGVVKTCANIEGSLSTVNSQMHELGQEVAILQTRTARQEKRLTELARGLNGVKENSQVIHVEQIKQKHTWKVVCVILGSAATATGLLIAALKLLFT